MDSTMTPLRKLANEASWFLRDRSLRLLSVTPGHEMHSAALNVLMGMEYHADNVSPFVRCVEDHAPTARGWIARARSIVEQQDKRRAKMAAQGVALAPMVLANTTSDSVATFAGAVSAVLASHGGPLHGIVVVLAPHHVADVPAFEEDLAALVGHRSLGDVRWIVVGPTLRRFEKRDGVRVVGCHLDEQASRRELAQMLAAAEIASPSAPGPAHTGAAWPAGVAPPSRSSQPPLTPAEIAAMAAKIGVPVGLLDGSVRALQPIVLRAASMLRDGRPLEAVQTQRAAVALAERIGMVHEASVLELMLGTYLVHAGDRVNSAAVYEALAARAQKQGQGEIAAQAMVARASVYLLCGDPQNASVTYARAGSVARSAGATVLAIEAFRLSGQLRADARDTETAIKVWTEAMAIAGALPPDQGPSSSAPLVARSLAAVCRKRGMHEQARALEQQADRLEHGASMEGAA